MLKYIHIGYPKCASTALQLSFFSIHPQIVHLGNGNGHKNLVNWYASPEISRIVESDLRYKRERFYDPVRCADDLAPYLEAASSPARCVGISSEFFAFTLGNEIDPAVKARRLRTLLPTDDVIVIMICREQQALLRSLYIELVKGGYSATFADFADYTLLYQDRNWCHDFCFDETFRLYEHLFGKGRVHVLLFEQLQRDPAAFASRLCGTLGIDAGPPLVRKNESNSPPGAYETLRQINHRFLHSFGGTFFEPFQVTRLRAYFDQDLGTNIPRNGQLDDFIWKGLASAAQAFNRLRPGPDINLCARWETIDALFRLYRPSNAALSELIGIDLRDFGYQC